METITKRTIVLEGTDIRLVISKATILHLPRPFFHLDELNDGTWRLSYSTPFILGSDLLDFISFENMGNSPAWMYLKKTDEDGNELPIQQMRLNKCVGVPREVLPRFIHIDGSKNSDEWKLIYSKNVIPNLPLVRCLRMLRED